MWPVTFKVKSLFLLFAYWVVLNYLVLHADISFFTVDTIKAIDALEFSAAPTASLAEANASQWQAVSLPDFWRNHDSPNDQLWYRKQFQINNLDDQVWSVYLPSVSQNAMVYINGAWIGQGGKFDDPVSRHHNRPLLFSFSSELLQPGMNQVAVRVKVSSYRDGLLGPFYLGRQADVIDAYRFKKLIRVTLVEWMTAAMYALTLIILIFWLARPQDSIYGIFALELFLWATHNLNLFVSEIPIPTRYWEAIMMSTLGWTVIAMIFFNHRYVGCKNVAVERFLKLFALLGFGLFLLPTVDDVLLIGYRVWDVFLIIFGSYAVIHLLRIYWLRGDSDAYLMLLVGLPILVFGLHDILVVNHFIDRQQGLIIQYSVVPAVLLFSWFLVRRFVDSINQAENLAANLEQRVAENKQELKAQYSALQTMQKQQVLSEERERIMRDMHDGIGGQLLSVINHLHGQTGDVYREIREKIQHSLTDLRFVIDSLDPLHNELPVLLGMMRASLQDQLDVAEIELEWAVTELPEISDMTPSRSLHLMRILQESITNVIKHSFSDRIRVATGVIEAEIKHVFIDVIDYGRGMERDCEPTSTGRGIDNMKYRAEQIGAELTIDNFAHGCRVRLLLPCPG